MNDKAEANLIEIPNDSFSRASDRSGSLTVVQNDATPMAMIAMAVKQGMSLDTIKELRTLQKEYEADEARKAYNVAFAKFKAEVIKVIKGKVYTDGPLKGKAYAELYTVVEAVTPHLSPNGLSASWSSPRTRKTGLRSLARSGTL